MGMGKLGYIGKKIVVILVSIGMFVFFVYLGEVLYGDFGMIECGDIVFVIFNFGELLEIFVLFFVFKCLSICVISMIGNFNFNMVKLVDIYL